MTIAKTIFGVVAVILFFLKMIGVQLGSLDMIAAGLFCLAVAIAPLPF